MQKSYILRRSPRHEASTTDTDSGRVGRIKKADARAGNSVAKGGPQLELPRRQLINWSKSEQSALVPAPTYFIKLL